MDAVPRPTLAALGGLAFGLMFGYGLCGSAAQSIFLSAHGSAGLAAVWLAVALLSAPVVAAVGRLQARQPLRRVGVVVSLTAAALLFVLLLGLRLRLPGMAFALYVWKDIYVVILVELLWTFANVAFGAPQAATVYGAFCAAGSLGSIAGSLVLGPLAAAAGSSAALWLTLPLLGLHAWGCGQLRGGDARAAAGTGTGGGGLGVLRRSRPLWLLLLLVTCVQVLVTLVDFQFNAAVARAYLDTDARARALGQVNAAVNTAALALQLGCGWLLRRLGLGRLLLGLPLAVGGCVVALLARPGYAAVALVKVVSKSIDYSLFRAIKEILYIPLGYAEKTAGKAVVDMLGYRVAKAGASLLLLAGGGAAGAPDLGWANLALCGAWLALGAALLRRRAGRGHPDRGAAA